MVNCEVKLRGTASQVRARGTATDSIQRQNARNRRVPDGVIRRVSNFLSTPMISADFFSDCVSTDKVALSSKMSVRCTLKSALQSAFQTCAVLFDKPRDALTETLARLDIHFETPHSILAAHSRIGAGPRADKNEAFEPKMIQSNARHWMIIVRSVQDNLMEVIAIPGNVQPKFYLQAVLALPDNHTVRNIQFGDSGNSSLSPNLDIDAVTNEGRQSLGLIIERQENSDKAISIAAADFNRENCVRLQTCRTSGEDDDNGTNEVETLRISWDSCVLSFGASTSLDILDLEEDDEDDSASGDESFEE
eukprot:scaffold25541_cov71-Skeletonema_marinoi.AAC.1